MKNSIPLSTVIQVGLGHIGSHTMDALGRLKALKRVVLVDPDVYEESNLASQCILRRDLHKPKVEVQARRLAEINPSLEIIPILDTIANVPRGWLRGAVVQTALHSAASRRDACEAAWRVGAPVVDAGVEPQLGLARVTVYVAGGDEAPCFECGLDTEDYEAMPVRHICGANAGDEDVAPTRGNASTGALIGAISVIEVEKLLAGQAGKSLAGHELVVETAGHKHLITRLRRNSRCRFNHRQREIRMLEGVTERSKLSDALEATAAALQTDRQSICLGVDGHEFARTLHCPGCGSARELLALPERLPLKARRCATCGGREMLAVGFKKLVGISAADASAQALRRPLHQFGVKSRDVLVAGDGNQEAYFEVPHE